MRINVRSFCVWIGRIMLAVVLVAALAVGTAGPVAAATQWDIIGPAGSGAFGTSVTALPNGNIVVTDPYYDAGAITDVGAVYLYDGATGGLISTLTGSMANDRIGYDGVTVLSNGNYVVLSSWWSQGAGAATWGNGTTGVSGVVSAANSLVGSTANDLIGAGGVIVLSNGNYVVCSSNWHMGAAANVGAVTWGNGMTGISGVVSSANSLVGTMANDLIGAHGVMALSNGNYVVISPEWDNGAAWDVGAVTWGNGATGISGVVSPANSLVGSTAGDNVGWDGVTWAGWEGVTALSNGNYVVRSPVWDNGAASLAGAATWGNGTTGITGPVSAANSLVGSTSGDRIGYTGIMALSNGNYVVLSPIWSNVGAATWGNGTAGVTGAVSAANSLVGSSQQDRVGDSATALSNGNYVVFSHDWNNGGVYDAGAATWGNGTTGTVGPVSAANSLVGSSSGDQVSYNGVTALGNGNYVVSSQYWDNSTVVDAGAVTWGNGTTGTVGAVSAANSLVGSTGSDQVGLGGGVTALDNGNYVVSSLQWDNGTAANAGAVTWGNGTIGVAGPISTANSLVGSTAYDTIGAGGHGGVTALTNGNYVVPSPNWDNGAVVDAGAATWGNGTTGTTGVVSTTNSLVGSTANDQVGDIGVAALSNGNYVVSSSMWWDNGNRATGQVGAVTWGNGTIGTVGAVSVANSLVGNTGGDNVGSQGVTALSNGDYVASSPSWNNGATVDAGAMTWGSGLAGVAGPITAQNSVRGTTASGGSSMVWAYDYANDQLVVGRPAENIVTLFRPFCSVFLPVILKDEP